MAQNYALGGPVTLPPGSYDLATLIAQLGPAVQEADQATRNNAVETALLFSRRAPGSNLVPALPLPQGARVMSMGHSMVQRGVNSLYNVAQTATGGVTGQLVNGRHALGHAYAMDGRFTFDVFADWLVPISSRQPTSVATQANMITGSQQTMPGMRVYGDNNGAFSIMHYVTERRPHIVYLDIGTYDVNSGPGGIYDADTSTTAVISAVDDLLRAFTGAGIWVAMQSLSFRYFNPAEPRQATLVKLNDWLVAQAANGRPGFRLVNTIAYDGVDTVTRGATDAAVLDSDSLNTNPRAAATRAITLRDTLNAMVTGPDPRVALDPTTGNQFPNGGLIGTGGTEGPGGSGDTSDGLDLRQNIGTSTYVGSKETISAGRHKQVVTVTPVNAGAHIHRARLNTTPWTIASKGFEEGDWIQAMVTVELDNWTGWEFYTSYASPPTSESGPVALVTELRNGAAATVYSATVESSWSNRTVILEAKFQIPVGLGVASQAWYIDINHRSDVAGTGVVKISAPILRKIATPRPGWNLTSEMAGWTPFDLGDSLLAWWDAEKASTMVLSGSAVTSWTDRKGGYVVTQATGAAQPAYNAAGFGGRPSVDFSTDDFLNMETNPFGIDAAENESWLIAAWNSPGDVSYTGAAISMGDGPPIRHRQQGVGHSPGGIAQQFTATGNGTTTINGLNPYGFIALGTPFVMRDRVEAARTLQQTNRGLTNILEAVPSTGPTRFRLGCRCSDIPGQFYYGPFNSAIVTRLLTDEQALQMRNWATGRGVA